MRNQKRVYGFGLLIASVCLLAISACNEKSKDQAEAKTETKTEDKTEDKVEAKAEASAGSTTQPARILPDNLVYQGAFRLPPGPEEYAWGWSGQGLAYYPAGDPKGPSDGCPGSLFGIGHNWHTWVSQVNIPKPVISKTKNLKELNTAKTLQKFADIRGTLFKGRDLEQPRVGLAYLPAQGKQTSGKLYFCWAAHLGQENMSPAHGWCELNLAKPGSVGLWSIAGLSQYLTCDYIAPIPADWAKQNTPGLRLATGRMRDGGQVSQGPTLIAFGPWNEGNPPKPGAKLKGAVLLKYSTFGDEKQHKMKGYHHSDDWSGVAWLTSGKRSAVVFVGTKGEGKCWYGFANGVVWPEGGPYPPVPPHPNDQRGWWSTNFAAQILFYDPADLAAVAKGKAKPHKPQPYAVMDISKLLFKSRPRALHRLGAVAFDPASGLLYVIELRGDEDKSLIHVWKLKDIAK
ncbi:MAG: hypothetical protein KAV00_00430 [Phycisphaerae bacterium]|nr:hypothetical protein [Phycisphaerae bacterium]